MTHEVWGFIEFCLKYKNQAVVADCLSFLQSSRHFTDDVAFTMARLMIKWEEKFLLSKLLQEVLIPRFENPRFSFLPEQNETLMEALLLVSVPRKDNLMVALHKKLLTPKSFAFMLQHVKVETKQFDNMEQLFNSYVERKFQKPEPRVFELMIEGALTLGTSTY